MPTGSSFNSQREISDQVRSKRFGEGTAPLSIPHPNREQALKRARLTAGFPNVVNGQRIDSSRLIKISDPVTGEKLASVTDTQKDGLDQAVQAAQTAFPLWSSKSWNELLGLPVRRRARRHRRHHSPSPKPACRLRFLRCAGDAR